MVDSINTAMYATPNNTPPNYLQMAGQFQQLQNAQSQNALLQQELPLRQAQTGIEQQNLAQQQIATTQAQAGLQAQKYISQAQETDPDTGAITINTNKLKSLCAQDPVCAPAMGTIYDLTAKLNAPLANGVNAQQQTTLGATQRVSANINPSLQDGKVVSPTIVTEPAPAVLADIKANQEAGQTANAAMKVKAAQGVSIADNAKLADDTLSRGVQTGKFAPAIASLKATAIYALGENNLPTLTGQVSDIQVLGKELSRVIQSQGILDPTDLARLQTDASNTDVSKAAPAIHKILQFVRAKGLQDQSAYQGSVATNGANPKGTDINDYNAKLVDPQVPSIYRYMIMSPEERQQFMDENFSTPQAKQQWLQKADELKKLGALPNLGQ